jgi:hypothetical protein
MRKVLVVYHGANNANPFFLLLLGREEDKKTRSVLLVSQPVASKGCPLSAGCWSSLLRGSRIPYIVFLPPGSRGSYAAAFPGPFLLVLRPEAIASS